ncbi:hypothetical protein HanIR_Chr17g0871341 [Helianthus annuus]|nr:hypothetical protein HanIR_Chr17g0871341 [Helianthus annuus]
MTLKTMKSINESSIIYRITNLSLKHIKVITHLRVKEIWNLEWWTVAGDGGGGRSLELETGRGQGDSSKRFGNGDEIKTLNKTDRSNGLL